PIRVPTVRRREKLEEKRLRLIRNMVKKNYSANLIQHKLREKGLGMRRKELLAKVREIKGVPKRPHPEKHVPIKYLARAERRRRVRVKPEAFGKWIAVYGTVDGESRRIELGGSGRALYSAMLHVAKHPPKKRFVRCHASEAPYYLDYDEEWDEHPAVVS
ncbi:MAG: hypothetical protein QXY74_04835, partial [Candidatus Bathyarchaeia archaeon]